MEQRDFFVSYTGEDEAWARWIADTLKSNGYTVYFQAEDIGPGDNFLTKMNEFLENSRNFIAVWSERYSKSRFCMTELQGAFHEWIKGRINRVLPVRIDRHPMEPLYAGLVHVKLPDRGAESEKTFMDAVRYAVPHPVTVPEDDAEALNKRGNDYYWGENGVQQDYAKARYYYEQAAAQGHASALFSLGFLYDRGYGVNRDDAKARDYYEQAAAKGHADALCRLGLFYDRGYGVNRDDAKAREYWEQAAAKGHAKALYNLGGLYEYGMGVSVDCAKALEYYQQAADAGDRNAPAEVERLRRKMRK